MQRTQTRRAPATVREYKTFAFREIKSMDEEGHFTGYLSVFGNADEGGDVVTKGAFKKTLGELETKRQKSGSPYLIPILWEHDPKQPIGGFSVAKEDGYGLYVEGDLDQDVQKGREARSGLKKGYIPGLSIGYDTIQKQFKNNYRYLTELRLWEGSVTAFPMNAEATVSPRDVKTQRGSTMPAKDKKAVDFMAAFQTAQDDLQEKWHDCFGALVQSLYSTMTDATVTDKAEATKEIVSQFTSTLADIVDASVEAAFTPQLDYDQDSFADSSGNNVYGVDTTQPGSSYYSGYMSADGPDETKSGAKMAASTHKAMGAAITQIQAGTKSLASLHAKLAPASAAPAATDDDSTPPSKTAPSTSPAKGAKSWAGSSDDTTHDDDPDSEAASFMALHMFLDRASREAKSLPLAS